MVNRKRKSNQISKDEKRRRKREYNKKYRKNMSPRSRENFLIKKRESDKIYREKKHIESLKRFETQIDNSSKVIQKRLQQLNPGVEIPDEEWFACNELPNYKKLLPNTYMFSTYNRIRVINKCRLIKLQQSSYYFYHLMDIDKNNFSIQPQNIVGLLFKKNPQNLPDCRFIDGNVENIYVGNIQWYDPKQEQIHKIMEIFEKNPTIWEGIKVIKYNKADDITLGCDCGCNRIWCNIQMHHITERKRPYCNIKRIQWILNYTTEGVCVDKNNQLYRCGDCQEIKPATEFNLNSNHICCTSCISNQNKQKRLKDLPLHLVRGARNRARDKGYDVSESNLITLDKFWQIFKEQHGKCANTGMDLILIPGKFNTVSIDRINEMITYVDGNWNLVMLITNGSSNGKDRTDKSRMWNTQITDIVNYFYHKPIIETRTEEELYNFMHTKRGHLIHKQVKDYSEECPQFVNIPEDDPKPSHDGLVIWYHRNKQNMLQLCRYCGEYKTCNEMQCSSGRHLPSKCKKCHTDYDRIYNNLCLSPRDVLQRIIKSTRRNDRKKGLENDLEINKLIQRIIRGKIRCEKSKVPLQFIPNVRFKVTLERTNNELGHTFDNIEIVIRELNPFHKDLHWTPEIMNKVFHSPVVPDDNIQDIFDNLCQPVILDNDFSTKFEFVPGEYNKHESKQKSVNQLSMDGKFIKKFNSITKAAKEVGLKDGTGISRVCKGKANSAGGFKWEYCTDRT